MTVWLLSKINTLSYHKTADGRFSSTLCCFSGTRRQRTIVVVVTPRTVTFDSFTMVTAPNQQSFTCCSCSSSISAHFFLKEIDFSVCIPVCVTLSKYSLEPRKQTHPHVAGHAVQNHLIPIFDHLNPRPQGQLAATIF